MSDEEIDSGGAARGDGGGGTGTGLAARGLTNREIGERLLLSPRTVSSHLYRSFPKLGVTARSQLRDLVEDAGTTGTR
ncbi:helix-turn-helix domain-containing protein [Nonomuraea lactucae]|uniref:helix-turn-helix domain-containing protein n=1 Tax=Nonomuraea lactucae TaxID=2249762 RepID=UPI001F05BBCC|nr:helix-turn-helix transcriptional regulator [Nonomuraea lactucae]